MEVTNTKHILIVEDSVDLQALLGRLLTKQGYRVSKAMNGQEGLDLLHSMDKLPSLILLDIMMPVMDGFVFRQELEKEPRLSSIPIVVMTADSQPEAKALTLHADALLKKPLDMNRLLEVAARLSA